MIWMSAVVFFSDKSSREDSLNMSYEESHSGQDNLLNVSQRSDMGNQRIQNDSKKGENIFLPKYDCIRHFDLSLKKGLLIFKGFAQNSQSIGELLLLAVW